MDPQHQPQPQAQSQHAVLADQHGQPMHHTQLLLGDHPGAAPLSLPYAQGAGEDVKQDQSVYAATAMGDYDANNNNPSHGNAVPMDSAVDNNAALQLGPMHGGDLDTSGGIEDSKGPYGNDSFLAQMGKDHHGFGHPGADEKYSDISPSPSKKRKIKTTSDMFLVAHNILNLYFEKASNNSNNNNNKRHVKLKHVKQVYLWALRNFKNKIVPLNTFGKIIRHAFDHTGSLHQLKGELVIYGWEWRSWDKVLAEPKYLNDIKKMLGMFNGVDDDNYFKIESIEHLEDTVSINPWPYSPAVPPSPAAQQDAAAHHAALAHAHAQASAMAAAGSSGALGGASADAASLTSTAALASAVLGEPLDANASIDARVQRMEDALATLEQCVLAIRKELRMLKRPQQ